MYGTPARHAAPRLAPHPPYEGVIRELSTSVRIDYNVASCCLTVHPSRPFLSTPLPCSPLPRAVFTRYQQTRQSLSRRSGYKAEGCYRHLTYSTASLEMSTVNNAHQVIVENRQRSNFNNFFKSTTTKSNLAYKHRRACQLAYCTQRTGFWSHVNKCTAVK